MKNLFTVLIIFISFMMKAQNINLQKEKLLKLDFQLEKLSSQKGTLDAFLDFVSDDVIIIPKFGHPIHGKETYKKIISDIDDKSKYNTKNRKPVFAEISDCGNFGYTFGKYELDENSDTKNIKYNYYASVWKKQKDGSIKIIINAGLIKLADINFITEKNMKIRFEKNVLSIVDSDKKFSELSKQKGYLQAFYSYIAENGLAASGNGQAPNDKEIYRKRIEYQKNNKQKSEFNLRWQPLYADISSSGELGFTHGHAQWIFKNTKGKITKGYSYYLSIWKKQTDKNWKFVFDIGNESQERK